MVAIMVTLCCALMVHVRARPVDLGNLVSDAPNRLDVTDLFMEQRAMLDANQHLGLPAVARATAACFVRCEWMVGTDGLRARSG